MNDQPVFRKELEQYMDAALPLLYVDTLENGKVQDILADIAKKKGRSVVSWSMHSGYVEEGGGYPTDLCGALASVLREQSFTRKILVLEDVAGELESPAIVSRLRCIAERIAGGTMDDCTVVLISPLGTIPRALEPYITLMSLDFLSPEKIREHILHFLASNDMPAPVEELLDTFAMHLRGLSETEIDNIISLAVSDDGQLDASDLPMVLRQKQQMIKKSGILEMVTVKETVEDIGGLQNLKDWLRTKAQIFRDVRRAKEFGVDIPKGVLIAGMPGCGKSLTAKAAASTADISHQAWTRARRFSSVGVVPRRAMSACVMPLAASKISRMLANSQAMRCSFINRAPLAAARVAAPVTSPGRRRENLLFP